MKVKELIEALSKYDGDSEIYMRDYGQYGVSMVPVLTIDGVTKLDEYPQRNHTLDLNSPVIY